jgi:hypothetical protein
MQRATAALLWQLPPQLLAAALPTQQQQPLPVDLLAAAAHALARSGSSSSVQQQQQLTVSPRSSSRPTSSSRQTSGQQQQQQRGAFEDDIQGKPGWQVLTEMLQQLLLSSANSQRQSDQTAHAAAQQASHAGVLAVHGGVDTAEAAGVGSWDQLQQQLLANLVQCCSGEYQHYLLWLSARYIGSLLDDVILAVLCFCHD